jgi:hypothetical protein
MLKKLNQLKQRVSKTCRTKEVKFKFLISTQKSVSGGKEGRDWPILIEILSRLFPPRSLWVRGEGRVEKGKPALLKGPKLFGAGEGGKLQRE